MCSGLDVCRRKLVLPSELLQARISEPARASAEPRDDSGSLSFDRALFAARSSEVWTTHGVGSASFTASSAAGAAVSRRVATDPIGLAGL